MPAAASFGTPLRSRFGCWQARRRPRSGGALMAASRFRGIFVTVRRNRIIR